VKGIWEHHLGFLSIMPNFFTLCLKSSDKAGHAEQIAVQLGSLLISLEACPVVHYCKTKLNQDIVSALKSLLERQERVKTQRQLQVIILDRELDIGSMLLHSSFYGSLVHNLLPFGENKVRVKDQTFDLSANSDVF